MMAAILDTSALIDESKPRMSGPMARMNQLTTTTITMAELLVGPITATTEVERAQRQRKYQTAQERFPDPLPFDTSAQESFGLIFALNRMAGRDHRRRYADLLIASIALANDHAIVTMNGRDFAPFGDDVEVIDLGAD